jgi:hypothetical protein
LGNIDDIDIINDDNDIDNESAMKTEYNENHDDLSEFISGIMPRRIGKDTKAISGNSDNSSDTKDLKNDTDTETDIETDYDEDDIIEIIDADDVEELDSFEKVKRVEVDELEKVYPDSIQKGFLFKYKTQNITSLQKKDENFLNNITKHINIISILKNNLTDENNNIIFKPQDYKPLVSKYIKGDFTNKFLIPLVINRKKIYLDKNKQGQKDEYDSQTHEVIDDYYENLNKLIYLQDKKNNTINNDAYTNNIINDGLPDSIAGTNVVVTSGAAIPAGIYRVLWLGSFAVQPSAVPPPPLSVNLYFKGEAKT